MTDEQAAAFLAELTELSKKHGIGIDGCGCCSSPGLFDIDSDGRYTRDTSGFNAELKWEREE